MSKINPEPIDLEKTIPDELCNELQLRTDILPEDNRSYEELKKWLAIEVAILFRKDVHRLFAYLYRIDVNEQLVKNIIHDPDMAEKLADLILKKLVEKAYWRRKYKGGHTTD